MAEAAQKADKPVMIAFTPGAAADGPRQALRDIGQFFFDRTEDALRVLVLLAEHDALRVGAPAAPLRPDGLPAPSALATLPPGPLTESEVKRPARGLRDRGGQRSGGPHAGGRRRGSGAPGLSRCAQGGVAPDRAQERRGRGAARPGHAGGGAGGGGGDGARAGASSAPDAALEGFSVQEMVRGEAEVIVGARRDPHFGPIAMVGLGGIAVEILKDVVVAPAPLSPDRARAMLAALRMAPLLAGARGRPPLDVDAIVDALVRLSWLAADLGAAPHRPGSESAHRAARRHGRGGGGRPSDTLADIPKEES